MPKQTISQKIGTHGQSIIETQIKASKHWIARSLNEDYGIDIELEFAPEEAKGKFIKGQIKSHQKVSTDKDFIRESLSKSYLRYVNECRIPIILIIVSLDTSKSWFIWLQKWIIDSHNLSIIYDESKTKSLTIQIPRQNDFIKGLQGELISIATWENRTQLYIALRDLANLSLSLYDEKLSQVLFDYIGTFKSIDIHDTNYLNSLIEKVLELGASIWATNEGYKTSTLLFNFIQEHGEKLNANHVATLIIRGKECSRTGINALGILYDTFPRHVLSLKLRERFKNFNDPRLYYYCTIRERYLGLKSPAWLSEENDLTVDNLRADFSAININIIDKWANRGDSVIFDYIYKITK